MTTVAVAIPYRLSRFPMFDDDGIESAAAAAEVLFGDGGEAACRFGKPWVWWRLLRRWWFYGEKILVVVAVNIFCRLVLAAVALFW